MWNFIITVAAMCVLLVAVPADALILKVTGVVQDRENVTPVANVRDSLTFAVQMLFEGSDSVGLTVQRLNSGDYIAGIGFNLEPMKAIFNYLTPYLGVGVAANINNFNGDGPIITGALGIRGSLVGNFGVFLEARTLTWLTKGSVLGVGVGITIGL